MPSKRLHREALLSSRPGEIFRNAFDWIDLAIAALTEKSPKLVSKFQRQPGWTYPDFHRFGAWLHEPTDQHAFATKGTTKSKNPF